MENSRNPNYYGIIHDLFEDSEPNSPDPFPTAAEADSDSRRNIPESTAMETWPNKAARKRASDRAYRERKKCIMGILKDENAQLKNENESQKREIHLLKQNVEIQSKELDGLRKMCDNLEKKYDEEHERNGQLLSHLMTRDARIESLNGELVELLKQRIMHPAFETWSNEMDHQCGPPGNLSSGRPCGGAT